MTNYSRPSGRQGQGPGPEPAWLVRAADQAGVDTVRVADHRLQADPTAAPDATETPAAHATLGFLAAPASGSGSAPW